MTKERIPTTQQSTEALAYLGYFSSRMDAVRIARRITGDRGLTGKQLDERLKSDHGLREAIEQRGKRLMESISRGTGESTNLRVREIGKDS